MTWAEWGVLVVGLVLGYAVVSMLMGERKVRPPPAAPRDATAEASPTAAPVPQPPAGPGGPTP